MDKFLLLLAIVSFCRECVSSFVYYSRQNSTSCIVGFGGLMDIIMMIGQPTLLILSIILLGYAWWLPLIYILSGWGVAKIISMIPFLNMILWILAYIGLPISVTWTIVELIKMYNI